MTTTVSIDHPGRRLTDAAIRQQMEEIARNRTPEQLAEHRLYQDYRLILAERAATGEVHPYEATVSR